MATARRGAERPAAERPAAIHRRARTVGSTRIGGLLG